MEAVAGEASQQAVVLIRTAEEGSIVSIMSV
jgi:hypothetical protein